MEEALERYSFWRQTEKQKSKTDAFLVSMSCACPGCSGCRGCDGGID